MNYNIAKRLRELRLQAHLTQEQAAMAANITPAFLGQIERGEKNPTITTVEKLCGVFNMSLSEFFSNHKYESKGDPITDQVVVLLSRCSEEEKTELFHLFKTALKLRNLE